MSTVELDVGSGTSLTGVDAAGVRCIWPKGCEVIVVDGGDLCPEHAKRSEYLHERRRNRCEARGEGWECSGIASTKKYGRFCVGHYSQYRRSGKTWAIRRRRDLVEQAIEEATQLLTEHGYTVTKEEK